MRNVRLYFFYFFIIAIILLGSIQLGPLSLRVYATILMIIYLLYNTCVIKSKSYVSVSHMYIYVYMLFVLLMGESLLLNGEFLEYEYPKKALAYYLVCIISYLSIEHFVNSRIQLNRLIFILSVIVVVNNFVTILQYIGDPIGWTLGNMFSNIDLNREIAERNDTLLGTSITPGIFGDPVKNAFMLTALFPLFFANFNKYFSKVTQLYYAFVIVTTVLTCFLTQQRAAFGLVIVNIVVYLIISYNKISSWIIILLALFLGMFQGGFVIDWGRLSSNDNSNRLYLWGAAIDYIKEHPFIGGPMDFQKKAGLSSHNLLLDSWIFAGLGGFLCMIYLYLKTIIESLKAFVTGFLQKGRDYMVICSALAVLNTMIYGLFHNTSYLTGSEVIFILLAIMLKSSIFTKKCL